MKPGDIYRYDKTRTAVKEVAVVDTKSSSVQDTFTRMFNPVIQIPLFGGFSAVSVTTLKQTITSDINAKTDRLQDTNTGHDFLEIKCPDFFSRSEQNKTFGDVCLKYEFVSKKLTQYGTFV